MKKIILIISLLVSYSVYAEVALHFDRQGDFIPPDLVLQERGLKAYDQGFLKSSKSYFKKSVKFGNDQSKYFLALVFFQNKNWDKAYAWLQLIDGHVQGKDALMKKVESILTESELEESMNVLSKLKKEYNDNSIMKRRNKWRKSLRGTGSHISGIDTLEIKHNITNLPITNKDFKNQIQSYLDEYRYSKEFVKLSAIKDIENNEY